tara:strand:- start:1218 stop:1391 length:174 start_codon:yes stop_codon:yes gene_type:complete
MTKKPLLQAKTGFIYLYYGGEQPDEVLKASSETEGNEIALKSGAEHWYYEEIEDNET